QDAVLSINKYLMWCFIEQPAVLVIEHGLGQSEFIGQGGCQFTVFIIEYAIICYLQVFDIAGRFGGFCDFGVSTRGFYSLPVSNDFGWFCAAVLVACAGCQKWD